MKCIACENEARALRKFCGRAVCQQHISQQRYVTGYSRTGGRLAFTDIGLSIQDTVWCGICHPESKRTI